MKKQTIIIIILIGLGIGALLSLNANSNHDKHNHSNHHAESSASCHHTKAGSKATDNSLHKHGGASSSIKQYKESLNHYFKLQKSLVNDNLENAKKVAFQLKNNLEEAPHIQSIAQAISNATSIKEARLLFEELSIKTESLIKTHGVPKGMSIGKYHCPMVDGNRGASWLQNSEKTVNPYFGSAMLHCGSKIETLGKD